MAKNNVENIILENCRIAFRNFSGKEGKFNPAGKRNFCVVLEQEQGDRLKELGWNIKYLKPRDEDELPVPYIQVEVSYKTIEPDVFLITSKKKTKLDEDSVNTLDYAEITNVDLIIRPYCWEIPQRDGTIANGIKAYVKTMYVTIAEDAFANKYNFDDEDLEIDY